VDSHSMLDASLGMQSHASAARVRCTVTHPNTSHINTVTLYNSADHSMFKWEC
jgi:hypothetical protein